ncbi:hypothetical protein D0Z00_000482 [Geotrichum galactomycetum]|uniref:Uncharacterized protein n=1 Tax=Geotrichum galactomycetum TaxID=27317 RepID=A0ACB6V9W7_9ASCO|nr:hypothetical protein D0Z00_000482 [Geotrichum candidum]
MLTTFIDFEDSEHAAQVLEDQSLRSFDGHKLTFTDMGVFETKTDIPNEIVKSLFGERRPRARGGRGRRPRPALVTVVAMKTPLSVAVAIAMNPATPVTAMNVGG